MDYDNVNCVEIPMELYPYQKKMLEIIRNSDGNGFEYKGFRVVGFGPAPKNFHASDMKISLYAETKVELLREIDIYLRANSLDFLMTD